MFIATFKTSRVSIALSLEVHYIMQWSFFLEIVHQLILVDVTIACMTPHEAGQVHADGHMLLPAAMQLNEY